MPRGVAVPAGLPAGAERCGCRTRDRQARTGCSSPSPLGGGVVGPDATTPENERRLLDFARCGTASHVERLVRAWRRVDRVAEANDERRRHETRELRTWVDDDGMVVIRGRLSPEVGAVVQRALEAASERLRREAADIDPATEEVTIGQRRADALGLVAESALAADLDRGTAGDRYQVVVHVDEGVLENDDAPGQSALEDGPYVSAEGSRRVACDAATVVMRHGRDGRTLDVGRKTRTVPPALRRALTARDRRCRFPSCCARHCDAHHMHHWAQGGATKLDNLVLLCRRHHRAVHEGGFAVHLADSGDVRFFWPYGRLLTSAPAAPRLGGRTARADDVEPRSGRHCHRRAHVDPSLARRAARARVCDRCALAAPIDGGAVTRRFRGNPMRRRRCLSMIGCGTVLSGADTEWQDRKCCGATSLDPATG